MWDRVESKQRPATSPSFKDGGKANLQAAVEHSDHGRTYGAGRSWRLQAGFDRGWAGRRADMRDLNEVILTASLVLAVKNHCQPGVMFAKAKYDHGHQFRDRNQWLLSAASPSKAVRTTSSRARNIRSQQTFQFYQGTIRKRISYIDSAHATIYHILHQNSKNQSADLCDLLLNWGNPGVPGVH